MVDYPSVVDYEILGYVRVLFPHLLRIQGNTEQMGKIYRIFYVHLLEHAFVADCSEQMNLDKFKRLIKGTSTLEVPLEIIELCNSSSEDILRRVRNIVIGDQCKFSELYQIVRSVDEDTEEKYIACVKGIIRKENPNQPGASSSCSVTSTSYSLKDFLLNQHHLRARIQTLSEYIRSDCVMSGNSQCYSKTLNRDMTISLDTKKILGKREFPRFDSMAKKLKVSFPTIQDPAEIVGTSTINKMSCEQCESVQNFITNAVAYDVRYPDYVSVGPFDIYKYNRVCVYHCLVNNCNGCLTTRLNTLEEHVKSTHVEFEFDWACSDCHLETFHLSNEMSLGGALAHLAKYHKIRKSRVLPEEDLRELNEKIANELKSGGVCPVTGVSKTWQGKKLLDLFRCENCEFSSRAIASASNHYHCETNIDQLFTCDYCPMFNTRNIKSYCRHIMREHGNARFKCYYCHYRSFSKANVVVHQSAIHRNMTIWIKGLEPIIKCNLKIDSIDPAWIKYYICKTCNFQTLIEDKYMKHLLKHTEVPFGCFECCLYEKSPVVSKLMDHLISHGIGKYRCSFCNEAFNHLVKAKIHLCQHHPSKFPLLVVCEEFESRGFFIKDSYSLSKPLKIGAESITLVALESEKISCSIKIINNHEVLELDDLKNCELHMSSFLKNTRRRLAAPTRRKSIHRKCKRSEPKRTY